jgi:ATP-dependent helicase/nuclease subunit A
MNVVFQASAGTGKTHQVTHLYVALVLGRAYEAKQDGGPAVRLHDPAHGAAINPRRILAMTFTENAAAELRTRVTELILKARYEAEQQDDAAAVQRISRVLRDLPGAPICTIHSFCTGLLRERAIEAGLSPGFAVLAQEEADALLNEAAEAELLARLDPAPGAPAFDPAFRSFCRNVRALGTGRGGSVAGAATGLVRHAASKGVDLRRAEELLPPALPAADPADFAEIAEALKRVRAARGGKLPDGAARVFQSLEKIGAEFSKGWKTPEREAAIEDALSADRLGFRGAGGLTELSNELQERVRRFTEAVNYRRHHEEIRAFARYAAGVAACFAERKQELGVVDFDDLLVRAEALLARQADGPALFDRLIVDEAQDTSRIQCRIIQHLWRPGANELLICGDTKQSIYAWRNADPRVMPDLAKEIEQTPSSRRVALRSSYRSKDAILEWVNRLFARVYGADYPEDARLVPAESRKADVRARGEPACVEYLTAPWDADGGGDRGLPDLDDRVRREMTAVAERIALLVNGPAEWRPRFRFSDETSAFEPAGPANRFRYGDVLVLLRRTTHQQILEHLLKRYRVPYRIGGRGPGLFARQEVKDLFLFLKALTDPLDLIALTGFLRSPLAQLTDDAILLLGWSGARFDRDMFRRNAAGPDGPRRLAESGLAGQAERLERAQALLRTCRPRASHRLASELVRDLLQETAYDAMVAGTFRGGQRLANVRRFIDWLRGAERGGAVLLPDVVRTLEEYADEPPDVPEATLLDPDQDAVTIMTVHSAKGLTARVVFVPELNSTPRADAALALLADGAEPAPVLHVSTERLDRKKVTTPGFDQARERAKDVRDAEAKNLFYVALTRARDLLVLSGASGSQDRQTWRTDIAGLLSGDPGAGDLIRAVGYDALSEARRARLPPEAAAAAIRPAAWFDAASERFPAPLPAPRVYRFPATVLSAFHHDPESFLRERLPALEPAPVSEPPQAEPADYAPLPDADAAGTRAAFGTAAHAMLEQLAAAGWRGDTEALARSAADSAGLDDRRAADLARQAERVRAVAAELTDGAEALSAEWPFALRLGGGDATLIVDGQMDLVFRKPGGAWTILDYKFTDEPPDALVRRYSLQLNLYRLALARSGAEGPAGTRMALLAAGRDAAQLVDIARDEAVEEQALAAAAKLAGQMDRT